MDDQKNFDSIFWHKGEGMSRRDHNIEVIKNLIEAGHSYQEISRIARRFFTPRKFNEYYEIAIDEIKNPLSDSIQSQFYSAKRNAEKINELRRRKAENGNG